MEKQLPSTFKIFCVMLPLKIARLQVVPLVRLQRQQPNPTNLLLAVLAGKRVLIVSSVIDFPDD
jgi:hypothetical protein